MKTINEIKDEVAEGFGNEACQETEDNFYVLNPSKGWFRSFYQAILDDELFAYEQLYKRFKDENTATNKG